jgi:hypothetical protein
LTTEISRDKSAANMQREKQTITETCWAVVWSTEAWRKHGLNRSGR